MTGLGGTKQELELLEKAEASLAEVFASTERTSIMNPVLADALTKVRGLVWVCENSIMLKLRREVHDH